MEPKALIEIKELLHIPKRIVIFTHVNPDGDAMGSLMGLYHFLTKLGHVVTPVTPNEFPFFLSWLTGANQVKVFHNSPTEVIKKISEADIIFCVDFNDLRRLKEIEQYVSISKAVKILIDHHPYPTTVFNYYLHRINASAAAELVYDFILSLGYKNIIDHVIAECIYAGIMSDTNSFNYNITDSSTFRKVADLLEYGIDHNKIYGLLYDNYSFNRMRLMGYCLNQKLVVIPKLHLGYIWLTQEEMKEYQFEVGDSEGFVNLPLAIRDIHISALLTEKDNFVRISCRSKGEFPVNALCAKHFEGGGHKNAAGGEIHMLIHDAIKHFEKTMETYADEIHKLYNNH
ncbi:MAG: bifunctional oligoribonuclease/PAP phosphatase NrnA [Bacteroidales bacterium]|nr:bifunctional oligoribonuclease/PAP phosphatase NrnA [Bacteroidales bacterium]